MSPLRKSLLCLITAAITVASGACAENIHADHSHAELHAKKGIAASELFPGYASLCDLSMIFRNVNVPRNKHAEPRQSTKKSESATEQKTQQKKTAKTPPMQVFDNLYFVGNAGVSAWLLGNKNGYILIDAMTSNGDAENIIEAGILELGLNPNKIEYLLITHGHGDHYGGHRYLKKKYNLPIVLSEADWQLAVTLGEHPRFGPAPLKGKGDIAAKHGDSLTAGTTTLDIHITPGHTMGTISPVFTVFDQGKEYRAALWGGTGFNFGANPEQLAIYAKSAQDFKKNAESENVAIFFSNHGKRDGSIKKMKELAERQPGEPHPFILGKRALDVYDVLGHCAMAQYDRLAAGDYPKDKM